MGRNFIPRPFVFDATAEAAPRGCEALRRPAWLGKRALFPYSSPQSNIFFVLLFLIAGLALILCAAFAAPARADAPAPAIAMHGAPALPADFAALPYANPQAPKGGTLRLGVLGTFDSLNPFNVKALSTAEGLSGRVFQSLMARSRNEPFTLYGLVAKSIETDAARDYVTFRLDPRARFSDGSPITADDVRFTFELLRDHGRPPQRAAFALVKSVTTPDALTIRFDLKGANDRELPLILALMPALSRADTDVARFEQSSLAIPVGSGPYVVGSVDPGRRIVYRRDPNYWARDLPVSRGLDNFDRIEIDYYRDQSALFTAFAAGLYDFRIEDDAMRWRRDYDFPRRRRGEVLVESPPVALPRGMSGFVFNTRRPQFADVRVREALASMFDFDWIDATLFGGAYVRDVSYFGDSALSSAGRPASARERALLAPFPGAVRAAILAGSWRPSVSDGSGRDRAIARAALAELGRAGYALERGALRDSHGAPFGFEILVKTSAEERLALDYSAMLARIGVAARVRLVDETQFQRRRQRFDFDMMPASFPASASPGAEQVGRWSTAAASQEGAFNIAGARSPAIDAMISALLAADGEEDFVAAARALDRVLLSGCYMVPFYHAKSQWIAYSARLGHPARTPLYGVDLDAWWMKPR
ncbi:MAG TPA: extracellular solute-binding protein [Roseiarcus sp.]|nr:extracellular solute-binding protein [Roseiarcus sp.]